MDYAVQFDDGYQISKEALTQMAANGLSALKNELPEEARRVDVLEFVLQEAAKLAKTLYLKS